MSNLLIKQSVVTRVKSILNNHSVSYCAARTSLTLRKIIAIKEGKFTVVETKETKKEGFFNWDDFKGGV